MMTIRTDGLRGWKVEAEWLGAVRTVFAGSLFDCIAFTVQ